MPVGRIGSREGPDNVSASQSLSDMVVFRHIDIIVAGDEIKVTYRPIDGEDRCRQKQADKKFPGNPHAPFHIYDPSIIFHLQLVHLH
jgi:hypothetical protein